MCNHQKYIILYFILANILDPFCFKNPQWQNKIILFFIFKSNFESKENDLIIDNFSKDLKKLNKKVI